MTSISRSVSIVREDPSLADLPAAGEGTDKSSSNSVEEKLSP